MPGLADAKTAVIGSSLGEATRHMAGIDPPANVLRDRGRGGMGLPCKHCGVDVLHGAKCCHICGVEARLAPESINRQTNCRGIKGGKRLAKAVGCGGSKEAVSPLRLQRSD